MYIHRRTFLGAAAGLGPVPAAQPAPGKFRLRYAPQMGWVTGMAPAQRLELFARAGFTAFEYNGLPSHSNAEIESLRRKREDLKLSMGVFVVNRGGWRPTAMPDKSGHARLLEDVRRAVEIHGIMGNEAATVTSGLGVPHLTFTQQTANCVEVLRRAAEIVEKTKLLLVLEPLNRKVDHAGYFVTYSEHAAEIVGTVNHPRVRILFDIYHQQISEGNLINHIQQYWDWIGYFQIGDVPGRKEPGTGEINWPNVFRAIHAKGYQGLLGGEHGLSTPGLPGFEKCCDAYRKADHWEA